MGELPAKAKIYISGTILIGICIFVWQTSFIWQLRLLDQWSQLLLLGTIILASITQTLKIEGATARSSYSLSWILYGFAIIYFGIPGALVVITVSHFVEWIFHHYPYYIQPFNIANYAIAAFCSGFLYKSIQASSLIPSVSTMIGTLLAMSVFTFVNHLLVGLVINFARGQNFSESDVFGNLTLAIDFTLLSLGGAAALVWDSQPHVAIIITVLPVYILRKTLDVPALERETQLDPKTGLINTRYFNESLERELERANRFNRPITIVMADLDYLRKINNNYGHIAGDEVLIGIAKILKSSFRGYDTVARFGGEEFSILVPEARPEQVYPRIDEIRKTIEAARFEISTSTTPISATMSFGIAGRQDKNIDRTEIIHNADIALYHAKANGRNRAFIYSEEYADTVLNTPKKEQSESSDASPELEIVLDEPASPFAQEDTINVYQEVVPESLSIESRKIEEPIPVVDVTPAAGIKTILKQEESEPIVDVAPVARVKIRPKWVLNTYIIIISLISLVLLGITVRFEARFDWIGLAIFAILTWFTEWFGIEVYDKNTTVSTSAAPLIAGFLLFGPIGVGILGTIVAVSALAHHRKAIGRIVFNISNQVIAGMACIGLVDLFNDSLVMQPLLVQAAVCILAAFIVYGITTALVSSAIYLDSGQAYWEIWKEKFRWLAPFYAGFGMVVFLFILGYHHAGLLGVIAVLVPLLIVRVSQKQFVERTKSVVSQLRATNVELMQQSDEITTINEELLLVLAGISDLRDPYVVGHSQHVSRYAVLIAEELGLSNERIERVRKAGLLHDIGKLGIIEPILFKKDSLTESEYAIVKQHVKMGADLLTVCHSIRDLVPFILHHHEHFDGRGYPEGLKNGEIPLEARILCLADAVEAMASDRHYHKAMDPEMIIEEIQANAGTQFDPNIVRAFTNVVKKAGHSVIVNSARRVDAIHSAHPQEISDVVFSASESAKTPWRSPDYF